MANGRCNVARQVSLWTPLIAVLALWMAGPTFADQSNKGLGPDATVPTWARNKDIHFLAPPPSSSTINPALSVTPDKVHTDLGLRCEPKYCPQPPVVYKGGPVQHNPTVYLIFWGSNFNKGTLRTEVLNLYNSLSSTGSNPSYQGILTQYWDNSGSIASADVVAGNFLDTRITAPSGVNEQSVEEEIAYAVSVNNWPPNGTNPQYAVFTPSGTTYQSSFVKDPEGEAAFCGYHGRTGGVSYSFIPSEYDEPFYNGCATSYDHSGPNEETLPNHATTMVASHEYAETVTDPEPTHPGWQDSEGYEIADICSSGDDELPGGSWVQGLWGNRENACVLQDPPYPPPPPPTATTEAATDLKYNKATLNGKVNSNGVDTHYYFEYGESTSYGGYAPAPPGNDAGYGNSSVQASAEVSTLGYNTTYHYRLVASSWTGTSYGADKTFTTPFPPPEVRTKPANELGPTIATLEGEVKSYSDALTYAYFEYGPTTSYGSRTSEENMGYNDLDWSYFTKTITGLAPNTTYHYRVVAYTNGGTTDSPDATFTTTVSPEAVTESPTNISANAGSVHASINPGGHSTTYQFEYWPYGKSSEAKNVPTTAESVGSGTSKVNVSQKIAGLMSHSSYTYRVRATNSIGTTYGEPYTLVPSNRFAVEPTPNPEGTKEVRFDNVSCGSPSVCVATGYGEGNKSVVEMWSGTEWKLQSLPGLTEVRENSARAVACPTSLECFVAGGYETGKHTVSERLFRNQWSAEAMPEPSGGIHMYINGLSCPSTIECFAVGEYEGNGGRYTLAERWNGSWTVQQTPNPSGGESSTLEGVSCTSATACTAVGYHVTEPGSPEGPSNTLVEHWNGTEWKIQTSPNPSGSLHMLRSVSCTSATSCMAVGAYGYPDGSAWVTHSMAMSWNGTEWSVIPIPNPADGLDSGSLQAVSCESSADCTAVGGNVLQFWNGSEWSVGSWSKPSGEGSSEGELYGVSCSSTTACTAVGDYFRSSNIVTLAEAIGPPVVETNQPTNVTDTSATLNGAVNPYGYETTYQFEYGPTQSYGTKVPATAGKIGAGWKNETEAQSITGLKLQETTYHYRIVATNSNGTTYGLDHIIAPRTWALNVTPNPTGATMTTFKGVSCPSFTACIGVGSYENSEGVEVTLGESWNGTKWTVHAPANPSGGKENYLSAVSCISSTACTAVGSYENSSDVDVALVERWNGTEWAIQSTPFPSGASSAFLFGVSCVTTTACTAVGYYEESGVDLTLVEHWNGMEWTIQSSPNPGSAFNELLSVSCLSTTECTAVGTVITKYLKTLIERWNGTEWKVQISVNPNETSSDTLDAVSCSTSTACMAVGDYGWPLAESWNGTEWSLRTISGPVGMLSTTLSGVFCNSSSACTTIGKFTSETGVIGALGEGWNGAEWTIQSTSSFAGTKESELRGVACPSATSCVAVGRYTNSAGATFALVESFGPPIATIEAATNITTSGATLNATVNPEGKETTYHFEYGTTTSYGTSIPVPDATLASQKEAEHVSRAISGLPTEMTYHYRIVATNGNGVTDSADHTFKTT
jgi:hypothetical protein